MWSEPRIWNEIRIQKSSQFESYLEGRPLVGFCFYYEHNQNVVDIPLMSTKTKFHNFPFSKKRHRNPTWISVFTSSSSYHFLWTSSSFPSVETSGCWSHDLYDAKKHLVVTINPTFPCFFFSFFSVFRMFPAISVRLSVTESIIFMRHDHKRTWELILLSKCHWDAHLITS